MGDLTEHFSAQEFRCPCGRAECPYRDGAQISLSLVLKLEEVRAFYGRPIIINSALRCPEHNRKVGGKPNSAHLKGLAVDIRCTTSGERAKLLGLLLPRFRRIGIAKTFIHVDIDIEKPQDVVWIY